MKLLKLEIEQFSPTKEGSAVINRTVEKVNNFGMSKMLLEDLKPGHDDDKEIYTKAYIPEERKAHTASTSVVKRKRRKKSS